MIWLKVIFLTKSMIMSSIKRHFVSTFIRSYVTTTQFQDHTSQDHFCSVIDEFPVWNSEPDQPMMMSWAPASEREEVSDLSTEIWNIDDRSSSFYRWMEGVGAVWVVLCYFKEY